MADSLGDPMEPVDFKFLKDRYDYELQRKEQLTAALTLPVGVLGGLGSLLTVMVRTLAFRPDVTTVVFAVFMVVAVCSFFTCLVQLIRAYHRQKYKYLPLLKELDAKLHEWRQFYAEAGYAGAEQDFFNHDLRAAIIESADRNTENNDERSRLLFLARTWLFALLGFTTVAGIAYIANQVRFRG